MDRKKQKVIIILGPSAVGKSDIAFSLAKELGTSIISSDAFQIYRGMDIGTGKPSEQKRKKVKHYLIDVVDPEADFDTAKFKTLAENSMEKIFEEGSVPIIVGGTGLYIRTLTRGICQTPPKNKALRSNFEKIARIKGKIFLYERLKRNDPAAARRIHPNDIRRIIRALEVYEQTGIPLSKLQKQTEKPEEKYQFIKIGLLRDRRELYRLAEERIEKMFTQGWINEVNKLLDRGCSPEFVSMHALGYREIIKYISGKLTLDGAKVLIKQNSRRFIKRQLTWFKKEKEVYWLKIDENRSEEKILSKIIKILLEEGILIEKTKVKKV